MLNIKIFTLNPFQVNTYIVFNNEGTGIIIDPACSSNSEEKLIQEFISRQNIHLEKIVNTHCHIDHIVGVDFIKQFYQIPFYAHHKEQLNLDSSTIQAQMFGFDLKSAPDIDEKLDLLESIKIGTEKLQLLFVPGHSPGSIVFYSNQDKFIIAGDVLFKGSIGRGDLPGGDSDLLISGIKEKLLTLPGDTVVYSGHGSSSTIAQEHDTNPFLI